MDQDTHGQTESEGRSARFAAARLATLTQYTYPQHLGRRAKRHSGHRDQVTNCIFIPTEKPHHYRCMREGCSNKIATKEPPEKCFARCRAIHGPTLIERAINFASAAFAQAPLMAASILTDDEKKAFRTREEIEAIAGICRSCPLFDGEICTHKDCGCYIDDGRNRWWSKIAWKSAHCPDNPPRW